MGRGKPRCPGLRCSFQNDGDQGPAVPRARAWGAASEGAVGVAGCSCSTPPPSQPSWDSSGGGGGGEQSLHQAPGGESSRGEGWGQSLHQTPGATGVAAPVQQGTGWAVLVGVVVGGWGRGQRRLVDDLDWGAWATQGCGATGVGGGRGIAGEGLAQQGLHAGQAGLVQDNDLDNLLALHQGPRGCGWQRRQQRWGLLPQGARLRVWRWRRRSPLGPQPGVVLRRLKPVVN